MGSQEADIQEEDDDDEIFFENAEKVPSVYVLNANSNMKTKPSLSPVPKEFRDNQARSTGSFS